jgi:hypothetical protein
VSRKVLDDSRVNLVPLTEKNRYDPTGVESKFYIPYN